MRQMKKGSITEKVEHQQAVTCCKFIQDDMFFTGSRDQSIKLWNLQTKETVVQAMSTIQTIDIRQQINSISSSQKYSYIGCNEGHCAVIHHLSNNFESNKARMVAIGVCP